MSNQALTVLAGWQFSIVEVKKCIGCLLALGGCAASDLVKGCHHIISMQLKEPCLIALDSGTLAMVTLYLEVVECGFDEFFLALWPKCVLVVVKQSFLMAVWTRVSISSDTPSLVFWRWPPY